MKNAVSSFLHNGNSFVHSIPTQCRSHWSHFKKFPSTSKSLHSARVKSSQVKFDIKSTYQAGHSTVRLSRSPRALFIIPGAFINSFYFWVYKQGVYKHAFKHSPMEARKMGFLYVSAGFLLKFRPHSCETKLGHEIHLSFTISSKNQL
jgi:hypothetical protein